MMADDVPTPFSLKRWSKRKLETAREAQSKAAVAEAGRAATGATAPEPAVPASLPAGDAARAAAPLPSASPPDVESLTFESDFTAFMQPKVDEGLKRQALKKLFSDPRFNVMDGLDTYIDDYSIPDPISADIVREMVQSRYIFDPPLTRVTAEGFVEDVPANEIGAQAVDAERPDVAAIDSASPPALPAAPSSVPQDTASSAENGDAAADEAQRERAHPNQG